MQLIITGVNQQCINSTYYADFSYRFLLVMRKELSILVVNAILHFIISKILCNTLLCTAKKVLFEQTIYYTWKYLLNCFIIICVSYFFHKSSATLIPNRDPPIMLA